jgi:hypothetical protein
MLLLCIIILFLHLLSTNHKCTQPCYFPVLYKPAAQKEKRDWNSSMRCFRLCAAPVAVPVVFWSLPLFHYTRVVLVLRDFIYVINILYSWHLVICEYFLSVCVEQLILGIHTTSTQFFLQNRVWQALSPSTKLTEGRINAAAINGVQWGAQLALIAFLSHFPEL